MTVGALRVVAVAFEVAAANSVGVRWNAFQIASTATARCQSVWGYFCALRSRFFSEPSQDDCEVAKRHIFNDVDRMDDDQLLCRYSATVVTLVTKDGHLWPDPAEADLKRGHLDDPPDEAEPGRNQFIKGLHRSAEYCFLAAQPLSTATAADVHDSDASIRLLQPRWA